MQLPSSNEAVASRHGGIQVPECKTTFLWAVEKREGVGGHCVTWVLFMQAFGSSVTLLCRAMLAVQ